MPKFGDRDWGIYAMHTERWRHVECRSGNRGNDATLGQKWPTSAARTTRSLRLPTVRGVQLPPLNPFVSVVDGISVRRPFSLIGVAATHASLARAVAPLDVYLHTRQ